MNRWEHPTRTCPTHGKPLLVTQSGVVFCAEGLDENNEPTCIHEAPNGDALPKPVARAIQQLRKRTRRMLRKRGE